jgi:hypothetical protein
MDAEPLCARLRRFLRGFGHPTGVWALEVETEAA